MVVLHLLCQAMRLAAEQELLRQDEEVSRDPSLEYDEDRFGTETAVEEAPAEGHPEPTQS